MLGEAGQTSPWQRGSAEGVAETGEHVAEAGEARHHRRLGELARARATARA